MTYWPSRPWRISISQGHETTYIEPTVPFAIIGSHERATARIEAPRLPGAVYLACAFSDSVELWPLTAISFPRWGVVQPQDKIRVDKAEIGFQLGTNSEELAPIHQLSMQPSNGYAGVSEGLIGTEGPRIIIRSRHGHCVRTLRRRVTIFGDDHPSTLRLHGFGLAGCSYGIIAECGAVWLIDLAPSRHEPDSQSAICLSPTAPPYPIGDITIAALNPIPNVRGVNSTELPLVANPSARTIQVGASAMRPSALGGEAIKSEQTAGAVADEFFASSIAKEDRIAEAELLARQVTSRLANFQQIRSKGRRQINAACFAFVLLILVPAICWPILEVILPLLDDDI